MLEIWSFAISNWVFKDFLDSLNGQTFGIFGGIFGIFGEAYEELF